MDRLSPPARIDDFVSDSVLQQWSDTLRGWFREIERELPAGARYFNLVDRPVSNGATATIPWNGFPRKYLLVFPDDVNRRWEHAENVVTQDLFGRQAGFFARHNGGFRNAALPFRDQDEYCEWRTVRRDGAIERIVFTCENPEYWEFLAGTDRNLLLRLYRDLVSPQVLPEDLFFQSDIFRRGADGQIENLRGRYNPLNRWNTVDGIVHLTHPANSLQAEIRLGGEATLLRKNTTGETLTDDTALICCARYGDPNRSSDPTIGGRINALVRNGLAVTIDDPVGLYISDLDLSGIETPDRNPAAWWRPVRPTRVDTRPTILRAEFAPPAGSGLRMSDVIVGGEPLRFGGQLAELLTMVIYGRGQTVTAPAPTGACGGKCCRVPRVPELLTIVDSNETCPSVEPSAGSPVAEGGVLAGSAADTELVVSEAALLKPRRY